MEPRILRRLLAAPFEVVLVGVVLVVVPVGVVVGFDVLLLPGERLLVGVVVVPEPVEVVPETLPVYEIVEVSSENVVVAAKNRNSIIRCPKL